MNATLRRSIAAAAVLLAAPALSSCGFDAPTDQIYNPSVGVNDRSGSVNVLHAAVVSGESGTGTVIAGLVNKDERNDDQLVGISSNAEGITVNGPGPVELPAGTLHQLADEGRFTAEGDDIEPGRFVPLTFTFERGEEVTLEVPVVARRGAFADVPVPPAGG